MKSKEDKEIQNAIMLYLKYGPMTFVAIIGIISLICTIINPTIDSITTLLVCAVVAIIAIPIYLILFQD